ncbi:MAG TPA: methylenetetrahydrofolate reductase [NAD(P)H] [Fimbriimonadaceae bacterium]|nr:methylenetetrahydrofolate reductase [NAD(P)H] [Fimbriimonadaceae bacterium]
MTVLSILKGAPPHFSFEFFPPKTEKGEKRLFETISDMKSLEPGFVSITCGAGGSTRNRTVEWAHKIKGEIGVEVVAHMTCLGQTRDSLATELRSMREGGIENVLALRGDPPKDAAPAPEGTCRYAIDLIRLVAEHHPAACVLAACYPEGHVDAESRQQDLLRLKEKCDAGVHVLVTQLFFDNSAYFEFVKRARDIGIDQPIVPGIMPVTDLHQVQRFTSMCGATIPSGLLESLRACGDDKAAVARVGVEYAVAQCRELLASGVPGIHFYTLNQRPSTRLVVEALR